MLEEETVSEGNENVWFHPLVLYSMMIGYGSCNFSAYIAKSAPKTRLKAKGGVQGELDQIRHRNAGQGCPAPDSRRKS